MYVPASVCGSEFVHRMEGVCVPVEVRVSVFLSVSACVLASDSTIDFLVFISMCLCMAIKKKLTVNDEVYTMT